MLGFGAIGRASLPLLAGHVVIGEGALLIIDAEGTHRNLADAYGAQFILATVTPANYRGLLAPLLQVGVILVNLTTNVDSRDLVALCKECCALYLDTSNEVWPKQQGETSIRTLARRRRMLSTFSSSNGGPTALICHGANPGLVSHFTKQALLDLAAELGHRVGPDPTCASEWAQLAMRLGVVRVEISECDSQMGEAPATSADEYFNTWSVDGLLLEALENVQFVCGTDDSEIANQIAQDEVDRDSGAVDLASAGAANPVRSWVPGAGRFDGFLISHPEVFSVAELLTLRLNGITIYRPTVWFAYLPCQDGVKAIDAWQKSSQDFARVKANLLLTDVTQGKDELGVVLVYDEGRARLWFGSELDIGKARSLAPHNNATSLQVAAGVLAGVIWVFANPNRGLVEPEQVDFRLALEVAGPYLGNLGCRLFAGEGMKQTTSEEPTGQDEKGMGLVGFSQLTSRASTTKAGTA